MLIVWLLYIIQKKRYVKLFQNVSKHYRDIHTNYKHVCQLYLLVLNMQRWKRDEPPIRLSDKQSKLYVVHLKIILNLVSKPQSSPVFFCVCLFPASLKATRALK